MATDLVLTFLNVIYSAKNQNFSINMYRNVASHICMPFILLYLSYNLVIYTLSDTEILWKSSLYLLETSRIRDGSVGLVSRYREHFTEYCDEILQPPLLWSTCTMEGKFKILLR